jgi:hypothetical protein
MEAVPKANAEYIIYKIYAKEQSITDISIGSVKADEFMQRKAMHKLNCEVYKKKFRVYEFIRNNGGFDAFEIDIIVKVFCNSLEARMLEEDYRLKLNTSSMNTRRAHRTEEQRCEYHKGYNKKIYPFKRIKKIFLRILLN